MIIKIYFMLKIILMSFISLTLFTGCSKTSTEKLDEMVSTDGTLKWGGSFKGIGSEKVSGQAKIFLSNNKYMLKLENFSTTNGPDLKVYLSKESTPSEFISLGDLKSTNGNQVYEINGTPDFSKHRFVLIHCERFNHLFGTAELTSQ
jgi:hypothetical protein